MSAVLNKLGTKQLSTQLLETSTHEKPNHHMANRFVFQGVEAKPMFEMESTLDLPQLNDGEVLVKVKAATICLSDIHTVCGTRSEPTPSVLGHEACVEVVEHRRMNSDLKVGDRITFSIADTCGTCEFCMNDLSQKCTSLFKVNTH